MLRELLVSELFCLCFFGAVFGTGACKILRQDHGQDSVFFTIQPTQLDASASKRVQAQRLVPVRRRYQDLWTCNDRELEWWKSEAKHRWRCHFFIRRTEMPLYLAASGREVDVFQCLQIAQGGERSQLHLEGLGYRDRRLFSFQRMTDLRDFAQNLERRAFLLHELR